MKILARTSLITAAAAVLVTGAALPAQAHTAAEAIQGACGSGYRVVSDGTRAVKTSSGSTWGYVYLTYNSSNGVNCVVTRKTAYHGTATYTDAWIAVQNVGSKLSSGKYGHYAFVKMYGKGHCVKYYGVIYNPSGTNSAYGGRSAWGNCG